VIFILSAVYVPHWTCARPVFRNQRHRPPLPCQHLSSSLGILHVTSPARAGGLESVVQLLARSQQAAGHRVIVAATVGQDESDNSFLLALAADAVESAVVRVGARSYVREWRGLRALCLAKQPDIVHTHGYRSDVIGSLASASVHTPRVTTVHGFTGGNIKNRANEWIQVRAVRKFDAVVPVSGSIFERLRKAGIRESILHTIPNAVDPRRVIASRREARRRLGLADEDFAIGWVGRMSREKDLGALVQALRIAKKPFKAVFVGDGPCRTQLQLLATSLGVSSLIQWQGLVPDAASLFSAFDVFVLSSRTEGIPIVLLEAMRAGVPIVATRVGGVPEMLGENEALLVASEQPDALAAAIDTVRAHADAARSRASAARARLEHDFAVESWIERYDAVYRSVLANRASK
jgi:glycosyltransferase involved in cell wall biosynthesis